MMKRIYLRGTVSGLDHTLAPHYFNGLDPVEVVDANENVVVVQDDGVAILRERAGKTARWFPNWRVIEVADIEDPEGRKALDEIERFEPVTLEDLAASAPPFPDERTYDEARDPELAGVGASLRDEVRAIEGPLSPDEIEDMADRALRSFGS